MRLNLMGLAIATAATQAHADGFRLPMADTFCSIASAVQSQWGPGIILICIVVEGVLFLVVKKGILQQLMVVIIAATLILSAGSVLHLIGGNQASCSAVS
ncbi:TrbC/VirB2 family protein [Undibacterium arcticum]|uniref:TrbC/VirB2 family protein n=2 Tax=Undibacterium arcticum TaxID=1762892 RepID=A0ABV7F518_9BURK